MKLLKLLILGLFLSTIILISGKADAANIQTYTFEGLSDAHIPNNYIPGITFSGYFDSIVTSNRQDTWGWKYATVSGVTIAYNNSGQNISLQSIDSTKNFSFLSGYFSSIHVAHGGDIIAIGYDNGIEKYRQAININGGPPPLTTLNFNNIDKVSFITNNNRIFGIDNLKFDLAPTPPSPPPQNPVPEPSSMVLGLMSICSALGFRKKNQ